MSDMRMPVMDGATLQEAVGNPALNAVRILPTGYADVGSTVAAINRGERRKTRSLPSRWDGWTLTPVPQ